MRISFCGFVLPAAIFLSSGYGIRAEEVYAVSFSTGELIRYDTSDPAGTRTTLLSSGSLVSPASMTRGPDGNLYIGENGDGSTFAPRISKFEPDTLTLSTVYAFSGFEAFPASLVFQGSDLLIGRNPYYTDTGPILRLSNATGGVPAISDNTTGGSLASSPGLALWQGSLLVSNQSYSFGTGIATGSVLQFDASGSFAGEVIADGANGLAGPTGLALRGDILYTASITNGDILQTNLQSGSTAPFASTGAPFEAGVLAALTDGTLLAGSPSGSGSIYQFSSDGTLLDTYSSGLGQVGGIVSSAAIPEPNTLALFLVVTAAGLLRLWKKNRSDGN